MPIRYVHNDPASQPFVETMVVPTPLRSGALATFTANGFSQPQAYALQTPDFADWQCREAALRAISAWERVAGPLRFWQAGQRSLALIPRRTAGLEAAYERQSIGFDYWPTGAPTFFVASSADAVSHEVGHAILDARRPELWQSFFAEVAAFHEAFADCISLLTTLFDPVAVASLFNSIAQPARVLGAGNAAAAVAESVAAQVKATLGAQHPASAPRQLKNTLQWAISTTLPMNPTPTNVSREPHSFGRVFSGCFYDCVDNIYTKFGQSTPQGLERAADIAGKLLAAAVESAPVDIRFFRAIGCAMIHADTQLNGGANHAAIRDAFVAHNVALGSAATLAPTTALAIPTGGASGSSSLGLNPTVARDLVRRVGAKQKTIVSARRSHVAGSPVIRATLQRGIAVPLPSAGGKRGKGVAIARVSEDVLVGKHRRQHVVLGELPNSIRTDEEVASFVEWLSCSGGLTAATTNPRHTHELHKRGATHHVRRIRFSCSFN